MVARQLGQGEVVIMDRGVLNGVHGVQSLARGRRHGGRHAIVHDRLCKVAVLALTTERS